MNKVKNINLKYYRLKYPLERNWFLKKKKLITKLVIDKTLFALTIKKLNFDISQYQ